jgi:hypothetical protein
MTAQNLAVGYIVELDAEETKSLAARSEIGKKKP